jgi:hypothetical protein
VANQEFIALLLGAILFGMGIEHWRRLGWRRVRTRKGSAWPNGTRRPFLAASSSSRFPDAAEQLRTVMGASFERRRLLSKSEARVFYAAETAIKDAKLNWRVMAQVNLGEILFSRDAAAFAAINSKRVDILIISNSGMPIAALEYQGEGHYQGSAAARDAVKKEALRKAGVRYIEVTPGHDVEMLSQEILSIEKAAKA